MSKGLERVEQLRIDINTSKDKLNDIEKELKALEIIKREPVEVTNLIDTYDSYEQMIEDYYAYGDEVRFIKSKEEFDLLKEVL